MRPERTFLTGLLALATCLALAGPTHAKARTVTCKDGTTASAGRGACSHHGGVAAETAPEAKAPEKAEKSAAGGATVNCKDGTTSKPGRGACSHHGGVAEAGAPAAASEPAATEPTHSTHTSGARREAPAAPARGADEDATGATARCRDGTYSHAKTHQGACSHHKGVAQWLDHE